MGGLYYFRQFLNSTFMQTAPAIFTPGFSGEVQPQMNMMPPQEDNALYVGNLAQTVTDAILYQYFQQYGKVSSTYADQLSQHQEESLHRRVQRVRLRQLCQHRR